MPRLDSALGRVGCSPEGGDTGEAANARQTANTQSLAPVCQLCGGRILDVSRTRPRVQHPGCTRLRAHLGAAVREAVRIGAESPGQARAVRRALIAAANAVPPVSWQRPRDSRGRFVVPRRNEGV